MNKWFLFLLVSIPCALAAQVSMTSDRYRALGLSLHDVKALAHDISSNDQDRGPFFDGLSGFSPSLFLSKGDSSRHDFLSYGVIFQRGEEELTPPSSSASGATEDVRQVGAFIMDLELGRQYVMYWNRLELSVGPSFFFNIARYKEEFFTDNALQDYIGIPFSTTTATRGMTGLRARACIGTTIGGQWNVRLSLSGQAGFRSIPDITTLSPEMQANGVVSLVRRLQEGERSAWVVSERVVPSFTFAYRF